MPTSNELQVRLLHAAKTQDQWKAVTSYPKKGEVCLEAISSSGATAFKIKIGDGTRPYCRNTGTQEAPVWDFTSENVLPYFGSVIETSGTANVVAISTYDTTKKKLSFYTLGLSATTAGGSTTLTPTIADTPYLEMIEGDGITFTTDETGTIDEFYINLAATTEDTAATITDGGTFTAVTVDSNNKATKRTTFTLPSISSAITTAINALDSNALTLVEYDSATTTLSIYSVTETDGIISKDDSAVATIDLSTASPVQDVQINGTSIVSSGDANIVTDGTYDSSTNKIATESTITDVINTLDGNATTVNTTSSADVITSVSEANGIVSSTKKTLVAGNKIDLDVPTTGTSTGDIKISHEDIDTSATDVASTITTDSSSTVTEKELDIITGIKVDAQGHITHIDKDVSTNLIAADIKAPVEKTDDDMWTYRTTAGTTTIVGKDVAEVEELKGKTLKWQQMCGAETYQTRTIHSYSNGVVTFNGMLPSGTNNTRVFTISSFNNHKYLFRVNNRNDSLKLSITEVSLNSTKYNDNKYILQATTNGGWHIGIYALVDEYTFSNESFMFNAIDLTDLFGAGNEPSTVAEFEALYPLDYYAYTAIPVLINNAAKGIVTTGFNQWDEEWVNGSYNYDGTAFYTYDRIRTINPIKVFPSTTYHFTGTSKIICFYDINNTFISHTNNLSNNNFTTPANCHYITFGSAGTTGQIGTVYGNDICINLSWSGYRNGEYEPYEEHTLYFNGASGSLATVTGKKLVSGVPTGDSVTIFPEGMKSAGSVYDFGKVDSDGYIRKVTKRIGSVDLGSLTWTYADVTTPYISTNISNIMVPGTSNTIKFISSKYNALPPKYNGAFVSTITDDEFICQSLNLSGTTQIMYLRDSTILSTDVNQGKVSRLNGVMLYYELATPKEYLLDTPIPTRYKANDYGTEMLLPQGVDTTTNVPYTVPFSGTIKYQSNFKDVVLDTIDKVNNYKNPVKSKDNVDQTTGKVAVYDSTSTVKSSTFTISNDTISSTGTDNETTVPTVDAVVDYIASELDTNVPVTNVTTTDTGTSGLEVTTSSKTKDVHHKTVAQSNTEVTTPEVVKNVVTGVTIDNYGHITGKEVISSDKLIAADIKAPVKHTDNTTWNYRPTGGDITIGEDIAEISTLKGNTLVWNQRANFPTQTLNGITLTNNNDGTYTLSGMNDGTGGSGFFIALDTIGKVGDKLYVKITNFDYDTDTTLGTLLWSSITALKDKTGNFDAIVTNTGGSLDIITTKDTDYTTPLTIGLSVINLTQMFGAGNKPSTVEEFEKLFPLPYYNYNSGELLSLGGRQVEMNQLVQNGNFSSNTNWTCNSSIGSLSIDTTNQVATLTVSAANVNNYIDQDINIVSGHKYYFAATLESSVNTTSTVVALNETTYGTNTLTANTPLRMIKYLQPASNFTSLKIYIDRTNAAAIGSTLKVKNVVFIDLTQMFGSGSEPDLEQCEKIFTSDYYEYNTGYNTNIFNISGESLKLKSTEFNQWDEEWETGSINSTTGQNEWGSYFRSKNYIQVSPGSTYYFKVGDNLASIVLYIRYYDVNKNYIGGTDANGASNGANTTRVMPSNCHYIRFGTQTGYGSNTYNNDICINISDPNRNGTYKPYTSNNVDFYVNDIVDSNGNKVFPYGLLKTGDVYDEITSTKAIKRVGSVDLGTLNWNEGTTSHGGIGYYFVSKNLPYNAIYRGNGSSTTSNFIESSGNYTIRPYYDLSGATDKSINVGIESTSGGSYINPKVFIVDSSYTDAATFKTAMSGVMLYYELAEPIEVDFSEVPQSFGTSLNLTYLVDDLGTEQQLPINGSVPITAPFNGTFVYKSNFKDTVIELIDKVNNAANPAKGINNTNQTVGKLAVYDSVGTVESSSYSASNATIVEGASGNDVILPSVETLVTYVNSKLSSALTYKGTINAYSDLSTSGQSTGDMYIVANSFTYDGVTYNAGDFFIWNGSSWDIVRGTTSVVNSNPTLTLNGNTYQVGTVDGVALQVTTPNISMSSPSASGNSLEFIDTVSQSDGLVSATKKTVPNASTTQTGVVTLSTGIETTSSEDSKTPTAYDTLTNLNNRDVASGTITNDIATLSKRMLDEDSTSPTYESWINKTFYPTTKFNAINDFSTAFGTNYPDLNTIEGLSTTGFLKRTGSNTWELTDDTGKMKWLDEVTRTYGYSAASTNDEELGSYIHNYSGVTTVEKATVTNDSNKYGFRIDIPLLTSSGAVPGTVLKGRWDSTNHYLPTWSQLSIEELDELDNLSTSTGYLRRKAGAVSGYEWELSTPDSTTVDTIYNDGTSVSDNTTNAGIYVTTNGTPVLHKVPFSAIVNDTSTDDNAVTIILNGNFS